MLDILRRTVGAGPHFFRLISDNLRSITNVTFCQSGKMLTKQSGTEGVEITEHTVSVSLSQEETLRFTPGTVEVQLRGLTNGGDAFATNVARVAVKEVLLKEVIT